MKNYFKQGKTFFPLFKTKSSFEGKTILDRWPSLVELNYKN
ncbi:MAG: hypothetical protein Q8830_03305 [Candidatus Phytoplasma australasiaticum]|nr:hypothetical protein [Candidatus Phytoplasma australasiaticum]